MKKFAVLSLTFLLFLLFAPSSSVKAICFEGPGGCVTPQYYDVNFNMGGYQPRSSISRPAGSTVFVPTQPFEEGYHFAGWYTSSNFSTLFNFSNPMPYHDITLYAKKIVDVGGSSFSNYVNYDTNANQVQNYALEISNDSDFFRIYLDETKTYFITSTGSIDTMATLYDSSMTEKYNWYDDDYSNNINNSDNFTVSYSPTDSGFYYLKVKSENSSTGSYGIAIMNIGNVDYDFNVTTDILATVELDSILCLYPSLPGTCGISRTHELFASVTVGAEATAGVIFAEATASLDVEVGVSESTEVSYSVDVPAGTNVRVTLSYGLYTINGQVYYRDSIGNIIYAENVQGKATSGSIGKHVIIN